MDKEGQAHQSQEGKEGAESGEERVGLSRQLRPQDIQAGVAGGEVGGGGTVVAQQRGILANEIDHQERQGVQEEQKQPHNGRPHCGQEPAVVEGEHATINHSKQQWGNVPMMPMQ